MKGLPLQHSKIHYNTVIIQEEPLLDTTVASGLMFLCEGDSTAVFILHPPCAPVCE